MHIPINHPLRPMYRFLAGATGTYLLAFGIVGVIRTWGEPLFSRTSVQSLGLKTNLAFALLSVVVGAVVLIGALIGRNVDHFINLWGGLVFMLSGLVMLALLQTPANLLNFEVATCIVSFLIGTIMFTAGLYGKTGTDTEAKTEEVFRRGGGGRLITTAQTARNRRKLST